MTTVETSSGVLAGRERDGIRLFAGVPYAAPPVGPLRFRAPRPHAGWSGPRDASRFGPASVQAAGMMETLAGGGQGPEWDEDCLTLNVVTPGLEGSRPVMVWIHGGGFTGGTGAIPWYDGTGFARSGDVVVVTINYRLGALGWLSLDHLDSELAGSGNNGLLDQIAALGWVRDNIAAFGGDPGNVTIFGESAGGMSVGTLLGTPAAGGLFHKAIAQSGAAHNIWDAGDAADVADRLVATLGGGGLDRLAAATADEILAAQQTVAESVTRDRASGRTGSGLGLPYGPIVDGVVLETPPLDAVATGSAAHVPVLAGTTRDEWNLFGFMAPEVADLDTVHRRLGRMTDAAEAVVAAYRSSRPDATIDELWSAIMTDRIFRIPAIRLAETQARHQPTATFLYEFAWATAAFDGKLGSCHALEIPFVWDNLDKRGVSAFTGGDAPQDLADTMHAAWIAFAHTGDPSHEGLPAWPAYDAEARSTMEFDEQCSHLADPRATEREAWAGVL